MYHQTIVSRGNKYFAAQFLVDKCASKEEIFQRSADLATLHDVSLFFSWLRGSYTVPFLFAKKIITFKEGYKT